MSNHPARNWRRRMRDSAEAWLISTEAGVLIDVPIKAATEDEWTDAMTTRIRRAYQAGFADGRKTHE